jgi:hypothetical protein
VFLSAGQYIEPCLTEFGWEPMAVDILWDRINDNTFWGPSFSEAITLNFSTRRGYNSSRVIGKWCCPGRPESKWSLMTQGESSVSREGGTRAVC